MPDTQIAALLCLCAAASAAAPQESEPASTEIASEKLSWRGARAESLGTTGRRLFVGALLERPGFSGSIGYGSLDPSLHDPLRLEVWIDGETVHLERASVERYASHQLVTWQGPGLRLVERKYVTEDDELIDELELSCTADQPLDLEVHLWGTATTQIARLHSQFRPLSLQGTANLSRERAHELSTMWSDPVVGRPENQLTGVSFTRGGYAHLAHSP